MSFSPQSGWWGSEVSWQKPEPWFCFLSRLRGRRQSIDSVCTALAFPSSIQRVAKATLNSVRFSQLALAESDPRLSNSENSRPGLPRLDLRNVLYLLLVTVTLRWWCSSAPSGKGNVNPVITDSLKLAEMSFCHSV